MTCNEDFETNLMLLLDDSELPSPEKEYKFHHTRKWRFDYAFPEIKLAFEIEGAIFGRTITCHACGSTVKRRLKNGKTVLVREGGRHNSGSGFVNDCKKYNEAAALGWRVLRFPTTMHASDAVNIIIRAVENIVGGEDG